MRWVGRILIILVAAAAVAGIIAVPTRNSSGIQSADARFVPGSDSNRSIPSDGSAGGRELGGGGIDLLGLMGTFTPIAVTVLIVLFIERLLSERHLKKRLKPEGVEHQ